MNNMKELKKQFLAEKETLEAALLQEKKEKNRSFFKIIQQNLPQQPKLNRKLYFIFNRFVSNEYSVSDVLMLAKDDLLSYFNIRYANHENMNEYPDEMIEMFENCIYNSSLDMNVAYLYFSKETILCNQRLQNIYEENKMKNVISKEEEDHIISLYHSFFCSILNLAIYKKIDADSLCSLYKTLLTMYMEYPQFFKQKINVAMFSKNKLKEFYQNDEDVKQKLMELFQRKTEQYQNILKNQKQALFSNNQDRINFLYNYVHLLPEKKRTAYYKIAKKGLQLEAKSFLSSEDKGLRNNPEKIQEFLISIEQLENVKNYL